MVAKVLYYDPYQEVSKLGSGVCGEVWKVKLQHDQSVVCARKQVTVRGRGDKTVMQMIEKEMKILQSVSHCHIIRYFDSYEIRYDQETRYCLLIQPVAEMDLARFFEDQKGRISDQKLCAWAPCLFRALAYLHDKKIRHKDIKPQNILIKQNEVYLADFGISVDLGNLTTTKSSGIPKMATERYVAPEISDETTRGRAADIWALGCVLLEMCTVATGRTIKTLDEHLRDSPGYPKLQLPAFYQSDFSILDWIWWLMAKPEIEGQRGRHIRKLLQLAFLMLDPEPYRRIKARELVELLDHDETDYFHEIGDLGCNRCQRLGSEPYGEPHATFKTKQGGDVLWPPKQGLGPKTRDIWEKVKQLWLESRVR